MLYPVVGAQNNVNKKDRTQEPYKWLTKTSRDADVQTVPSWGHPGATVGWQEWRKSGSSQATQDRRSLSMSAHNKPWK